MIYARYFVLAVILCLSAAGVANTDASQAGELRAPFEAEADFGESPAVIRYRFASSGESTLRVQVRATVRDGEASWVLRDPRGRQALRGHVTRGRGVGDTGEIEAIDGIWELTINNADAQGSYAVIYQENEDA